MRKATWLCFVSWGFCGVFLFASAAWAREWTDATGSFKVEGEFVAVRSGKVILEKTDGKIISVPIQKLSAADQEFIKSLDQPKPDSPSRPSITEPVSAENAALAQQAAKVLKTHCYRCHGAEGMSEGGFNFAINLPKLARTLVKPGNAAGSPLFQRLTAVDDSAMPPIGEEPRPTAAEIATIKSWVEAGAPAPSAEKPREFISGEQIASFVAADIEKADARSRRYLRYFTLTHLYNAGVSMDELHTYRNALVKLINSLSWSTELIVPQTVDPARTIFRIDMRDLKWNVQTWEQIEQANPYFLPLNTREASTAYEATQCRMPYIRADWFVFAASRPPLYHTILGVPETDLELESLLRVNVAANIQQDQAIRAAFNRSGVSQNNRLIEWHESPYGSYWKSYDFAGNSGKQNLFEYPLGPGTEDSHFQHDGGELIFTLPNGLQGYLLVDANGKRIDQGPINVVSDPKRPDKTVMNGVSCMSCHYTGVIPKTDELGPAVRANPKAYEHSADILALYRNPAELNRVIDQDAKRFAAAMQKLGISSLSRSGEPISAMAQRFEQELDLPLVAHELGVSVEEFLKRLDNSDVMSRRFASLRTPGGVIKRDVYASGFLEVALELKLIVTAGDLEAGDLEDVSSPEESLPKTARMPKSSGGKPGEVGRVRDLRWGVKSLAFGAAGNILAAGKLDRELRLFDVETQGQVAFLDKLEMLHSVDCCAFIPNGTRLLVGGASGHIVIYSVAKNGGLKEVGQFAGHSKGITCIAVSSDGRFALSGSDEKKARYWEIATGKELAVFTGFEGKIKACHISSNGRVGMATDGAALLDLDLNGKHEVKRRRELTRSWAAGQAAAFSSSGSHIAAGDGYSVRLWNLKTSKELPKMEAGEIQWSMAFTPDGSRILTGGTDRVDVWDVRKASRIFSLPAPDSGYIQSLAASPDNKHAAATGRSDIFIFRLPGGR